MYNEEIQDRANELMVAQGLQIGRIIHPITDYITPNAVISTIEDGPFWYGDLAESDITKLKVVAGQLKRTLLINSPIENKSFQVSVN